MQNNYHRLLDDIEGINYLPAFVCLNSEGGFILHKIPAQALCN